MSAPTQYLSGMAANRPYPGIDALTGIDIAGLDRAHAAVADLAELDPAFDPGHITPGADVEDFFEDALRASAALRACRAAGIDLQVRNEHRWPTADLRHRFGPVARAEQRHGAPDPLVDHFVVASLGGRLFTRATYTEDSSTPTGDYPDLVTAAKAMVDRGVSKLVLKDVRAKTGIFLIEGLHPSDSAHRIRRKIVDATADSWILVQQEDVPGTFVLQQWVPMEYEYRMFLVDGVPVTGAGCIEEYTPLHNHGEVFDPRVRRTRNNHILSHGPVTDPIETRPDLIDHYLEVAELIGTSLDHGRNTVVVDLAWEPEQERIVVVELNTLPNSGLYACDVDELYRALVTASDRGYWAYPFAGEDDERFTGIIRNLV